MTGAPASSPGPHGRIGSGTAARSKSPGDELTRLREENERLRRELDRSASMAALGELTATATHEFNNVLMTVINYSQMGMRNPDTATRDRALAKIHDASLRAAAISKTILAGARNRDDAVPTALGELIEGAMMLLSRELQKYRVAVEMNLDANSPKVSASGNQIQRVLINLIVNARQAMPEGGTLSIATTTVDDGTMVEVMVRDTGVGIAADQLPKIFDRYFSTKTGPDASGLGGTGLGLSACKEIIDAHGGRIRVESTPGRGTAFRIRLPVAN